MLPLSAICSIDSSVASTLGCLYYCLETGQTYCETTAFPHAEALAA
jgi:hypothetical protein